MSIDKETELPKRRLGRTGHESTVVTFGAAGIGRETLTQDQVDELRRTVFPLHGIG